MMVVVVETKPTFSAGTPRILFEGGYELDPYGGQSYDVTPDGQRSVMVQREQKFARCRFIVFCR